ncbi:MAG: hypothetical protein A2Y62_00635 [Candidatus Fischerbacteria bacterium RBG_13_37_8]|uniref:Carbohydrate deacetylase n=1 Tax=Candidatus Fischerbacteria bacterium RBG_13_37_8 TaxID=1817863 RepID=A0A1F5VNI8_9BACT|nr:MAG: hypothetical protein A2Y62_00635 [Candidatus Fischerbacteria bacterium RBG_13_37_8]
MNQRKLIVNADDCGFTKGINQGVIEGHKRGIITSCSLMACGDYMTDFIDRQKNVPNLSVGVHLTLSNTKPTLSPGQVPFLINKDGYFHNSPAVLIQRLMMFPAAIQQVKAELYNQCMLLINSGIKPSHLDSHKHFHLYMPLFKIIIQLALEFNIKAIRVPYDSFKIDFAPEKKTLTHIIIKTLTVVQKRMRKLLNKYSIKYPDNFFGIEFTGYLSDEVIERAIRKMPPGVTELMCHPGHYTKELKERHTRLKESRKKELKALTAQKIKEVIKECNIELINYHELQRED